jgi:hypothetical protein
VEVVAHGESRSGAEVLADMEAAPVWR